MPISVCLSGGAARAFEHICEASQLLLIHKIPLDQSVYFPIPQVMAVGGFPIFLGTPSFEHLLQYVCTKV